MHLMGPTVKASGNGGKQCIKWGKVHRQAEQGQSAPAFGFGLSATCIRGLAQSTFISGTISCLDSDGLLGTFSCCILILRVSEMQWDNGSVSLKLLLSGCVSEGVN